MKSSTIIFLSYINRSGSTFLAEQISAHPDVCVCPEAEVLIRLFLRDNNFYGDAANSRIQFLKDALNKDPKLSEWGIRYDDIESYVKEHKSSRDLFERFLFAYRDIVKPKARLIIFKGTELLKVYENTPEVDKPLCIVITRDGRAAYASQKKSRGSLSGMPMQVSPIVAAKQWSEFTSAVLNRKEIFHIRYEDLVIDKEVKMREVWAYLGLHSPEGGISDGDLTSRIPENQKHLHINIGRDPIFSRIDSWKKDLSAAEITLYETEAGAVLASMNYTVLKPLKQSIFLNVQRNIFAVKHFWNQLLNRVILRLRK